MASQGGRCSRAGCDRPLKDAPFLSSHTLVRPQEVAGVVNSLAFLSYPCLRTRAHQSRLHPC